MKFGGPRKGKGRRPDPQEHSPLAPPGSAPVDLFTGLSLRDCMFTNYKEGGGLQNHNGEGAYEVLPIRKGLKGGGGVLAMLKGGAQTVLG